MIVYRIENKNGVGVYQNNPNLPVVKYTRCYYEARKSFDLTQFSTMAEAISAFGEVYRTSHPDPERDPEIGYYFYMNPDKWIFGFDSIEQLYNWFPKNSLKDFFKDHANTSNEVFVSVYETDDVHTSVHQAIFNKDARKLFTMNLEDFVSYTEKGS